MLGKITSIKDNNVYVALSVNVYDIDNIIGKNVVFDNHIIGEVSNMSNSVMEVSLIGEIKDNKFIYGNLIKPSFKSECRIISGPELDIIYNVDKTKNVVKIGKSFLYNSYDVYLNINSFFANHFAILGNTGSGKSYSVSRLLQGIFYDAKRLPYNTNIFLFDAYGEYQRAFVNINQVNPNLNYKVYTTDLKSQDFELLRIPFWLLGVDDICLLLNVNDTRQIPIIEKALKLVCYFCKNDESVIKQKNDIIARSLLDVIFSGKNHSETRNKIVSILSKFSTNEINLEIKLVKGGWARSLRQCIYVEESGNFADIELVISYLEGFCMDDFELSFPDGSYAYTIKDFYTSLEFALISEGIFNSNKVFDYANILKIRLNSLMNSDYVNYFIYDRFITKEQYINTILAKDNGKAQIINFNINYVDDRFAKVIVKIYSKLLLISKITSSLIKILYKFIITTCVYYNKKGKPFKVYHYFISILFLVSTFSCFGITSFKVPSVNSASISSSLISPKLNDLSHFSYTLSFLIYFLSSSSFSSSFFSQEILITPLSHSILISSFLNPGISITTL